MIKKHTYLLLVISINSYAGDVVNSCWDEGANNNFNVFLDGGSFSSNQPEAQTRFSLAGMPSSYKVRCWLGPRADASAAARLYSYLAKTDLTTSENSNAWGTYLKLTNDVDVRIDIDKVGTVPVTNASGTVWFIPDSTKPDTIFYDSLTAGLKVKVSMKLRRKQIGGVVHIPGGIQLFRLYNSINYYRPTNEIRNVPIMTISTSEQYIPLPVACKINNNAIINIDFGDIDNKRISRDGSNYIKTVPLKYSCNTAINQNIAIHVVASPAPFSSDFITTSLPDSIGVMIKYKGNVVKPNDQFNTVLINGMGQDELQVAPVINDPNKSVTGEFSASATLVMTVI
ncbi:TPA: fimbrial protein [Serratia marcescens]